MRRKSLDLILSVTGLVMAVVLAGAGVLFMIGGTFAHSTVTTELGSQKISFGEAATLPESLQPWAGVVVADGPSAKAYSDLIGVHVQGIAEGKTYSEVSGEWMAATKADPVDEAAVATLGQQRTTLFMGETLRGMLLNAYAFWTLGTIAIVAAWVSWIAAVLLLVLAFLGFAHAGSTPETEGVFEPKSMDVA